MNSFSFLFSLLSLSLSGNSIRDTGSKTVSRKCRGRRNREGARVGEGRKNKRERFERGFAFTKVGGGTPCDLEEHGVVYKAKGKHR